MSLPPNHQDSLNHIHYTHKHAHNHQKRSMRLRITPSKDGQAHSVMLHVNGESQDDASRSSDSLAGSTMGGVNKSPLVAEFHVYSSEEQAQVDVQYDDKDQAPFFEGNTHSDAPDRIGHHEATSHPLPTHGEYTASVDDRERLGSSGEAGTTTSSHLGVQSMAPTTASMIRGTQRMMTPSAVYSIPTSLPPTSSFSAVATTEQTSSQASSSSPYPISAFSSSATPTDVISSLSSSAGYSTPTNGTDPSSPSHLSLASALHTPPFYITIVIASISVIALLAAVIAWAIRVRSAARWRRQERILLQREESDSGSGRRWWSLPFVGRAPSGRESLATVEQRHSEQPPYGQPGNPDNGVRINLPVELEHTAGRLDFGDEFGMGSGTDLSMKRTVSSKRRHQRAEIGDMGEGSVMIQVPHQRPIHQSLNPFTLPNPYEQRQPQDSPALGVANAPNSPYAANNRTPLLRLKSLGLGIGLGLDVDLGSGLRATNLAVGDKSTSSAGGARSSAGTSIGMSGSSTDVTPSTSATYLNPTPKPNTSTIPTSTFASFPSLPSVVNTIGATFAAAFSPTTTVESEDKYTQAPQRASKGKRAAVGDDSDTANGGDQDHQSGRAYGGSSKTRSDLSRPGKLTRKVTGLLSDTLTLNPASRGISRRSRSRMQRLKSSSRSSHRPQGRDGDGNGGRVSDNSGDGFSGDDPTKIREERPNFLSRTSSSAQSTTSQVSASSEKSYASLHSEASFMSSVSTNSSRNEVMTAREKEARDALWARSYARSNASSSDHVDSR